MPGVDLARGLAVLGMLAAHLLTVEPFDPREPATWVDVVNGRSSILFAVLAGVSLALVTGGAAPVDDRSLRDARRRITVRAIVLWIIGIALILTGVPVYVILPAYALLFLLALPLLGLHAGVLWTIALALAIVMPWVQPVLAALPVWDGPAGGDLALVLGWHYPATLWIVFVVAGLAAARSDLRRTRTQVLLLVGGALAAAASYAVAGSTGDFGESAGVVWSAQAHSGGLWEVWGSGGFALAVLGGAILLCRTPATWIVLPLRAVGSMPLTAYVGQIVAWAVAAAILLGGTADLMAFRALDPLPVFVVVTMLFCTAWAVVLGRGPLERLLAWITRIVAR